MVRTRTNARKRVMLNSIHFEDIVQTLREPLIILDEKLMIRIVNRAFLTTFQVRSTDVVGAGLYEIGGGEWRVPEFTELLDDVIPRNAIVEDLEITAEFDAIGVRVMKINARRLDGQTGSEHFIMLAMEDVTAARAVESERQRLLDELTRSNAELERFAYVASHDLQEPLRMVSSYTQIIGEKYADKLDEKGHRYIAFAVDGAQRMQALINGLLHYSRIGTRGSDFTNVDMNQLLKVVLRDLEIATQQASAAISCADLPPVYGDKQQLMQLFQNLFVNALKFRGPRDPVIRVTAAVSGEEVIFSVADNGIGIDGKYFEKLFIVFQRLHTRTEYPGHGIGLAVSKRIVERHGGRIWIESTPGAGSTFYFGLQPARGL